MKALNVRTILISTLVLLGVAGAAVELGVLAPKAPGVIRIGYAINPPYAFVAEGGGVTGASVQSARIIARRLGRTIVWVQTDWADAVPGLLAGRFDLIESGMFVTPARARDVAFAPPELKVNDGLLVPAGNPARVFALGDFVERPDLRLAIVDGSAAQERLLRGGVRAENLFIVPDVLAGRVAVETGAAQAFITSFPTVEYLAREGRGLEGVELSSGGVQPDPNYIAAAFAPQNSALLAAWSAAQREEMGGTALTEAIAPFGLRAANIAAGATLEAALKAGQ